MIFSLTKIRRLAETCVVTPSVCSPLLEEMCSLLAWLPRAAGVCSDFTVLPPCCHLVFSLHAPAPLLCFVWSALPLLFTWEGAPYLSGLHLSSLPWKTFFVIKTRLSPPFKHSYSIQNITSKLCMSVEAKRGWLCIWYHIQEEED